MIWFLIKILNNLLKFFKHGEIKIKVNKKVNSRKKKYKIISKKL